MNTFLKWCLYIGVLLLFLVVSAIGLAVYYQDEVKAKFVEQLNNHVDSQIKVDGEIELSFIKSFPQASVSFPNVSIRESLPNSSKNFLEAEELLLVFNITDLLKKNYTVKKLKLRNGYANILTTQTNAVNYHFWKTNPSSTDSSQFELKISDAELTQFSVVYDNRLKKHFHSGTINRARIQGRFDKSQFDLSCDGDLFLEVIQTGKQTFIEEQQSKVSLNVIINKEDQSYTFENSTISILDDEFKLNGTVIDELVNTNLKLKIQGDDLNMASIISLLPPNYREKLKGFRSEGNAYIDIYINGKSSMKLIPAVNAKFGITDGILYHPNIEHSLTKVSTTGLYKNKHDRDPDFLRLSNISGMLDNRPFEAEIDLTDLSEPNLDIQLTASADLKEFQSYLNLQEIKKPTGIIELTNFKFSGKLQKKNFIQYIQNIKSSGQVTLTDIQFDYHDQHIERFDGTFEFNNKYLFTEHFLIAFNNNDFDISGTFGGLFESIANLEQEDYHSPLSIKNGAVQSKRIHINELQKLAHASAEEKSEQLNSTYFDITQYLRGPIAISVESFKWNDIDASTIEGTLELKEQEIKFSNTTGSLFSGESVLNGSLFFEPSGLKLKTKAICTGMSIKQMFEECRNFGQDEITYREIGGELEAVFDFTTVWNNQRLVESDQIALLADLTIKDGELKNYSSLEALSEYVNLEDLKHVQFSELKNQIKIENRTVQIPSMHIESNAMDIDIQGTHSFDHEIDYFFRINLLEVLATKFKKRNSEFDDIETKPEGNIDFYVSLIGTVQDYDISFQKSKNKQAKLGPSQKKSLGKLIKDEIKGKPISTNQKPAHDENEELEFIDWE